MSFIMSGKNLALSSLQPHGDDLVAITAGKHAQFFHGWKYAWGVNICQGVKHIDSLFANRPACGMWGHSIDKYTEEMSSATAAEEKWLFQTWLFQTWLWILDASSCPT